jgi:hypothetical protein
MHIHVIPFDKIGLEFIGRILFHPVTDQRRQVGRLAQSVEARLRHGQLADGIVHCSCQGSARSTGSSPSTGEPVRRSNTDVEPAASAAI